jgi:hypothetical protein
MTPSGIEPATFRFVAQYLNHCATISGPLKPQKTLMKTRIILHHTVALLALLYGSENWTIKARRKKNNTSRDEIHDKNIGIHLGIS